MSCEAFSPNRKQVCSKIGLIKGSFGFLKRVFYYRNKWSDSGPDNFGLIKRVSLLTVGFISGDYCNAIIVSICKIRFRGNVFARK